MADEKKRSHSVPKYFMAKLLGRRVEIPETTIVTEGKRSKIRETPEREERLGRLRNREELTVGMSEESNQIDVLFLHVTSPVRDTITKIHSLPTIFWMKTDSLEC